ncbi:sigma 54-interacting transcriptional regulator [Hyalangium sp.]|uniref:sigma 54-interacting transcriptional regulator n=1 Tax=Hyalangium sp. TaxID=2028555 RepID=UPI002D237D17|nr:sigma 54-interacting transcriptional regulator [Hyalangium sp.]HYH96404.1 sigma 54-interacting transcriptional regulator [Hyalangium sp.]
MNTTTKKPPVRVTRSAATASLVLVFSGGEILLPPRRYAPGREGLVIGREAAHGIALPRDPQASRKHATVHRDPLGELLLVDEGSRNGTCVNGQRVTEAVLREGDVIEVGDSFLVVSMEPEELGDGQVPELLGTSAATRRLRALLAQVAPSDATVLLLSESGCGKEVAARAVHTLSGRRGPFLAVNCGAIPESLAESLLFGNLAGVFTGAVARPGLFRAADGGTLFLDEVGELPASLQPKLLRVLQERTVLAVGATTPHPCDVRLVAATNRDLKAAVAGQGFRGDLYARLAEFPVHLPPLRKRREDVLLLLAHALGSPGAPVLELEADLVERLLLHPWPYNVREVLTLAKQLRILAGVGPYRLELIEDSLRFQLSPPRETPPPAPAEAENAEEREPPPDRAQLEELLRLHRGVVADVARAMSRSRKQVYRWLSHHGLKLEAFRHEPP